VHILHPLRNARAHTHPHGNVISAPLTSFTRRRFKKHQRCGKYSRLSPWEVVGCRQTPRTKTPTTEPPQRHNLFT